MPFDLTDTVVIGISSRALFDLEAENEIFETHGKDAYRAYQIAHEDRPPKPGTAFPLVEALLRLNRFKAPDGPPLVEVVIMSRNAASIGLRIFNAINEYKLGITRAAFTSGASLANYLEAFEVDLFLSKKREDVAAAIQSHVAAAIVQQPPCDFIPDTEAIRIAFDADAVVFSSESERIYKDRGIEDFQAHEMENARKELAEGPFGKLVRALSILQNRLPLAKPPIRLGLVTARNAPAHERVIRTLRAWNVEIDEMFFMGGLPKDKVLKAFRSHIFFDDQTVHVDPASKVVPAGHVPSGD